MTDNTTQHPLKPDGRITATFDATDTLPLTIHHRAGLTIALDAMEAAALLALLDANWAALEEGAGEARIRLAVERVLALRPLPPGTHLTDSQWEEVERRVQAAQEEEEKAD